MFIEKRSCVFRDLVKELKYYVCVFVINRKGLSDWYNGFFDVNYVGEVFFCKKGVYMKIK